MKRKPAEALSRFWATDRGLSILLGFLVVAIFLLPLLRDHWAAQKGRQRRHFLTAADLGRWCSV